jgi:hypothetical protein
VGTSIGQRFAPCRTLIGRRLREAIGGTLERLSGAPATLVAKALPRHSTAPKTSADARVGFPY